MENSRYKERKDIEEIIQWQKENEFQMPVDSNALSEANYEYVTNNIEEVTAQEINNTLDRERNAIIDILVTLLDEKLEQVYKDGSILKFIMSSKKNNKETAKIIITMKWGGYEWPCFYIRFDELIEEMCYNSFLYIFKRQVRYKGINLRNVIELIEDENITDYKRLVFDIIRKSKSINWIKKELTQKGFEVSSECIINKNRLYISIK